MADTILYFSNALDAATVTVNNNDSQHPQENLQDRDGKTKTMPSASGNFIVVVDAGEEVDASNIIIPNHNLYTKSLTGINVQIDDNIGFTSPENILATPGSPHAPVASDEPFWNEIFEGVDPLKTSRYWRLQAIGATTLMEFGDLYLTKRVQILDVEGEPRTPGGDWTYAFEDQSAETRGRGFVTSVTWGEPLDVLTIECRGILKSVRDEIHAAYKSIVRGKWLPWFYSDEYGILKKVKFAGTLRERHRMGVYWDVDIPVREQP